MTSDDTPRIAPVERRDADPTQQELFDRFGDGEILNLFATLAHHPKLMRSWLHLGGRLLMGGILDAHDREVLILRTSMRCGSHYEWGQHVAIARSAGLTDEEILACGRADPGGPLGDFDQTLLHAADELVADHVLTDTTWSALAERYDQAALIEVTMLVGHYVMLAGLLSSLRVATEGPLPRIGAVA